MSVEIMSFREKIAALSVLLPIVLVGASIGWYGQAAVPGFGETGSVVVNLTGVASDGVWTLEEVNGLNYWWKTFEPATVFLRVGDEVVLNLRSADLFHQLYIPAFAVGPVDVEPGHMATVRFTVTRPGVFQYYCTSMCGTCHFYMRGWIVVTPVDEEPVQPPPILCSFCLVGREEVPPTDDLLALGEFLYRRKGCSTCHGPEGRGGVENDNSTGGSVPDHATTAQKLFIGSPEDAEAFLEVLASNEDLGALVEEPEIGRFPVIRTRFENAKEIVRQGRYSAKLDPEGPEPPLQMPAWQYLVEEREIDALLGYFITLYPWDDQDAVAG
jgi:plastocyanin/mono/diheme cytochrome c family protein